MPIEPNVKIYIIRPSNLCIISAHGILVGLKKIEVSTLDTLVINVQLSVLVGFEQMTHCVSLNLRNQCIYDLHPDNVYFSLCVLIE